MERVMTTAEYTAQHSTRDIDGEWHETSEDMPDVVEPPGTGWRLISMCATHIGGADSRIFWCWERASKRHQANRSKS